jgi:hypothetical protein
LKKSTGISYCAPLGGDTKTVNRRKKKRGLKKPPTVKSWISQGGHWKTRHVKLIIIELKLIHQINRNYFNKIVFTLFTNNGFVQSSTRLGQQLENEQ